MKITTHICKILDLGLAGNLFGGRLMEWLDEAASVYACYITKEPRVVTRRFSEALFDRPIRAGELVEFHCEEPRPGHTSISFKIKAMVNDEIRFQAECTFVAVDQNGRKKAIDWENSRITEQTLN